MKFWHANRLDQEAEYDPRDVARQFIAACRNGYDLSRCRPSIEWTFRWWLTDGMEGFNVAWEQSDDDALMDALAEVASEDDRAFLWGRLLPA